MEGCSSTTVLKFFLFCILSFSVSLNCKVAAAGDIIGPEQILRDDGSTIVSSGGHFELGFVTVGSSANRYVGIWYKKIAVKTIVWIANREAPLNTSSNLLRLNSNGNLVILNASDDVVWSSNSTASVNNPVVQLLDSGNLVIRDESESDKYLWQSFDKPGDTQLPGAKLGWNLETGLERYLTSWKSLDDPSPGEYTNYIDRNGFPQQMIRKASAIDSRAGPWNGLRFSGTPNLNPNQIYTYAFVSNDKDLYYHYEAVNSSVYTRRVLNPSGHIQRWVWIEKSQIWQVYHSGPDDCDHYRVCGAYGSCNIDKSPVCMCFNGFQPRDKKGWDAADWSSGCARKENLSCVNGDGFVKHSGLKLPDTQRSWFDKNMSLGECEKLCLSNCSCTAYANTDVRGSGSGCLLWFNELIDIRDEKENGQDLYFRMAASELGIPSVNYEAKKGRSKVWFVWIPILMTVTMMCVCLWVIRNKKKKKKKHAEGITNPYFENCGSNEMGAEDLELPLFDFTTLDIATNGFSKYSMLGEGGFGPVYKGMLDDGKEIAVKRLSKDSRQGLKEFKNEVSCIARLQHRNLVKLLGCSVQEGERMLVYEYMPNKSLDSFIFDKTKRYTLDWPTRYNIINGIARGLLYLHQDSRLRIIHRDLKASNVLLDLEMNPKISDFGTARICGETETGANTTRVVGTYGYMSPEYATDGIFSVKSDVYSFGVLLLEMVNGKRNKNFTHLDHNLNLLGHAYRTYKDGNVLDLVDEVIKDLSREHQYEVFRAIQIGLLCVQQCPADRPTMATVVLMLTSELPLPQPKQPGFFIERNVHEGDSSSCSSNYCSVTAIAPR
ncbi:G-type lectin S-receptor-like serine/threonine-protein kinase At4g27290 isoform X2 [Daucus carota subsp. sativus]|uniref:G-type lectin S-receptor-like serine/threonine-protein kinase At4g27290 isoform X2 n=1 Tax=Daucus carota subsp. sativus TaxID=79200 RepID=UPI003083EA20